MSRSDARCATPYIYSGELQIRPEVDAALAALKDKPYTAIPSSLSDLEKTGAFTAIKHFSMKFGWRLWL